MNTASGRDSDSAKVERTLSQQVEQVGKGLMGCGCLTVLGFIVFTAIAGQNLKKDWQQQDHSADALIISRTLVKQKLLSPTSAKFPGVLIDGAMSHVHRQGQTYSIESYVDSQNVFGAMLRARYKVTLKRIGPELHDFEIKEVEVFDP